MYEVGRTLREIEDEVEISRSTLDRMAKKEGWQQGVMRQPIQDLARVKKEHETILSQIPKDNPILSQMVQKESDKLAKLENAIDNLLAGATNLHSIILKDTINKTKTGELTPSEASRIVATQGLSVDKIANISGISKEKGNQTNIQLNNNIDDDKVVINIAGK
jgi:hypothetical protein